MGSFCDASLSASCATSKDTHLTQTLSYFTTATKCSGAPFPFPILTSAGFLVIGLSGNSYHN